MLRERRKAEENLSARNTKMGSSHTTFVESETRESVESQINQFEALNTNRSFYTAAMRERDGNDDFDPTADPKLEDDPYFNADEIAFQVRLQCHKERRSFVRKLGGNAKTQPVTP